MKKKNGFDNGPHRKGENVANLNASGETRWLTLCLQEFSIQKSENIINSGNCVRNLLVPISALN